VRGGGILLSCYRAARLTMAWARRLWAAISRGERTLIAALLLFNLTILFLTIVMRFTLDMTPRWTEEASRYLMIWIVYLGVSQSIETGAEVRILLLPRLISSNAVNNLIKIAVLLICIVTSSLICIHGTKFAVFLFRNEQLPGSFRMPMGVIYLIIPASALLMALRYAIQLLHTLRSPRFGPSVFKWYEYAYKLIARTFYRT